MSKKNRATHTPNPNTPAARLETEPSIKSVKECWQGIVDEMKLVHQYRPPASPQKPTVVVKVRDPHPQTARQMAEVAYPKFNWQRYDELEHEAAQVAIEKLNHRRRAPLGRPEPKVEMKIDNRTEIEKMLDKVTQQTGKELIKSREVGIQNKEDMAKAVEVAYSANGNNKLERHQVMAIAALCWELGLSPNPTLGHVYGFEQNGRFMVMMGVYGLINLARRDHEFVLQDARDMTDQERQQHSLKSGDVGVMVGIIDGREIATFAKIVASGIPVKIEDMYHWYPGVWRSEVERWDKEAKKKILKPEDIPNTWTARQVAEKRAIRTALKRLGLNSNVGRLPNVPGYQYDAEEAAFVYEPQPEAPQSATTVEQPIEGQFEELLATQVQAEAERDSAVIVQEPVEVAPETADLSEVKPAESAGEVVTPETPEVAAIRDLRELYESGFASYKNGQILEIPKAARIIAMFQNVIKPNVSQEIIGEFIKKLITSGTLAQVTTSEWSGLLAVINANPTADEIWGVRALMDKQAQEQTEA